MTSSEFSCCAHSLGYFYLHFFSPFAKVLFWMKPCFPGSKNVIIIFLIPSSWADPNAWMPGIYLSIPWHHSSSFPFPPAFFHPNTTHSWNSELDSKCCQSASKKVATGSSSHCKTLHMKFPNDLGPELCKPRDWVECDGAVPNLSPESNGKGDLCSQKSHFEHKLPDFFLFSLVGKRIPLMIPISRFGMRIPQSPPITRSWSQPGSSGLQGQNTWFCQQFQIILSGARKIRLKIVPWPPGWAGTAGRGKLWSCCSWKPLGQWFPGRRGKAGRT